MQPQDREEAANILTHLFGTAASLVGVPILMWYAIEANIYISCAIYSITLLMMFISSVIYHCMAKTENELMWRRIDHCCIYLFIAGAYTPFVAKFFEGTLGIVSFVVIWGIAVLGIIKKMYQKDIEGHNIASLSSYLVLGWYLLFTYPWTAQYFPETCFIWLLAGGLCYTGGTYFFMKDDRPFFHAIWHACIVAGTAIHFCTVMKFIV